MPRFLQPTNRDAPYGAASPVRIPAPRIAVCSACTRGVRCAGRCGKRVCKLHAYGCSRCPGRMCEPCWERHELGGEHG